MTLAEIEIILKSKPISWFVNEYLFFNRPVCFDGNAELLWEIKEKLASNLNIHKRDIEIVGSGKLGISLSDERFGQPYNKKSDIDIALISPELFYSAWDELLKLEFSYYKLTDKQRIELNDSYNTIHRGFISPERLPKLKFKELWWSTFAELSNKSQFEYRKIRGRLFRNWYFAEKYYSIQIGKIIKDIKNEN